MPNDQTYHRARARAEQAMAAATAHGTARIVHLKLARLHRASAKSAADASIEGATF